MRTLGLGCKGRHELFELLPRFVIVDAVEEKMRRKLVRGGDAFVAQDHQGGDGVASQAPRHAFV